MLICNIIQVACELYYLHVNIIIMLHVNIITLHVDIIHLACRRQRYATIAVHNTIISCLKRRETYQFNFMVRGKLATRMIYDIKGQRV